MKGSSDDLPMRTVANLLRCSLKSKGIVFFPTVLRCLVISNVERCKENSIKSNVLLSINGTFTKNVIRHIIGTNM